MYKIDPYVYIQFYDFFACLLPTNTIKFNYCTFIVCFFFLLIFRMQNDLHLRVSFCFFDRCWTVRYAVAVLTKTTIENVYFIREHMKTRRKQTDWCFQQYWNANDRIIRLLWNDMTRHLYASRKLDLRWADFIITFCCQWCRHSYSHLKCICWKCADRIKPNFTRFSLVLLVKQNYSDISIVFHFRWLVITYMQRQRWQCSSVEAEKLNLIEFSFN